MKGTWLISFHEFIKFISIYNICLFCLVLFCFFHLMQRENLNIKQVHLSLQIAYICKILTFSDFDKRRMQHRSYCYCCDEYFISTRPHKAILLINFLKSLFRATISCNSIVIEEKFKLALRLVVDKLGLCHTYKATTANLCCWVNWFSFGNSWKSQMMIRYSFQSALIFILVFGIPYSVHAHQFYYQIFISIVRNFLVAHLLIVSLFFVIA